MARDTTDELPSLPGKLHDARPHVQPTGFISNKSAHHPATPNRSCLAATDLYRYLAQEHDATIIGVLLGMAASKRCGWGRGGRGQRVSVAMAWHGRAGHCGCHQVLPARVPWPWHGMAWQEMARHGTLVLNSANALSGFALVPAHVSCINAACALAAPCRGSQDSTISKTLFLHLPTRHPSSYPELDISPLVQVRRVYERGPAPAMLVSSAEAFHVFAAR